MPVQPRTFEVLRVLASRLDQAVSRQELLDAAWPGVTVVDNALTQVMRRARAALGDDPDEPTWLVSVPRYGYRLRADGPSPAPTRLPSDSWLGRDAELRKLLDAGPGLVTVVGAGGVGKTRLARELTARAPAVWVDLDGVDDPEVVPVLVSGALGLSNPAGLEPALQRLSGRLVLDNAEALVARDLAASITTWCAAAPELRLLATSRIPTGAPGERVLRLEPLSPVDAARLLDDRAGRPLAGDRDHAALLERLDGLPLAIELFAVHARFLPIRELVARLDGRVTRTGDGRPGRPARHETLQACLDATWELLPPVARAALLAVATFETTFDAAGADAVAGRDGAWTVPTLCDHGLVRREPERERWRLPAAVKEWARTREAADPAWLLHARHVAGEPDGATPAERLAELVAAVDRVGDRADPDLAHGLGSALVALYDRLGAAPAIAVRLGRLAVRAGPWRGALRAWEASVRSACSPVGDPAVEAAYEDALAHADHDPAARAEALRVRGVWRWRMGRAVEALADLERARDDALESGAPVVTVLGLLARAYRLVGRPADGVEAAREALARARETEPEREGEALVQLAALVRIGGRYDEALGLLGAALPLVRAHSSRQHLANALSMLGNVRLDLGDPAGAVAAFEEALALHVEDGNRIEEGGARLNLGLALRGVGDPDRAEQQYREAVATARAAADRRTEAFASVHLGASWVARGARVEGREEIGRATALAESIGHLQAARWGHLEWARASLALGEADAALAALEALPEDPSELSSWATHRMLWQQALRASDPEAAERHRAQTDADLAARAAGYTVRDLEAREARPLTVRG